MPRPPGSGRKPKYTSAAQIEEKIEQYFTDCQGHPYRDPETGEYVFDKHGQPIILDSCPPTVTGLALALGFTNRMDLLRYQAKAEFTEVITKAKSRVEAYTEARLFDRDGANGARFSLQCNFKWGEDQKKDAESAGPVVRIVCDIPRTTPGTEDAPDSGANVEGARVTQAEGAAEVSGDAANK
jgi:hypothetical protein